MLTVRLLPSAQFSIKRRNIGAAGAVSYMFDNTGVIVFAGTDPDHIFEILLNADVDVRDVTEEEGNIVIYTESTDLHKGIAALKAAGITEFSTTELEMIAQSEVELSPEDLEIFCTCWMPLKMTMMFKKSITTLQTSNYK